MRTEPLPSDHGLPVLELRRGLLDWFATHARDLPWRRRRTLYGTWIAEIMLQQTTVQAVVPYWQRFMATFPDVRTLAAAPLDQVLSLWSGLGYYRRARKLHAAANIVVAERDGRLPEDRAGWSELPGIGPYASGAIASIGLGESAPALDANARRVIMRWASGDLEQRDRLKPKVLDRLGAHLVSGTQPGRWNEAVMELGALVCGARATRCGECPVRGYCRAHQAGIVAQVPAPASSPDTVAARVGLLALHWGDRMLLLPPGSPPAAPRAGDRTVVRADFGALHRGLWGLPMTVWFADEGPRGTDLASAVWDDWLAAIPGLDAGAPLPRHAGVFNHGITRFRLRCDVFSVQVTGRRRPAPTGVALPPGPGPDPAFVSPADPGVPLSRLAAKALEIIGGIPG